MAASDEARRLLAKAAEDEYVLDRLLDDDLAPDSMIGFHAQQATEKLLKAALFHVGAAPPRTHQLVELLDQARTHGLVLPAEAEALRWLTPYAVFYRYDFDSEDGVDPLPRQETRTQLRRLRAWVEALLEP